MKIEFIENIASTHLHVSKNIREGNIKVPYLLYANNQYEGIGSRENSWIGDSGNLYMSFCIDEKTLHSDVPYHSICIYCAMIMKEILNQKGSRVWLKWPNDFYIGEKKIGGIMSCKIKDIFVVSMGINLLSCPQDFATLDINISNHELVECFCKEFEKKYSWKQIFSKFRLQFHKHKNKTFHLDGKIYPLSDAKLNDDGSITIKGKKVYNLR